MQRGSVRMEGGCIAIALVCSTRSSSGRAIRMWDKATKALIWSILIVMVE